jgi:hypothetical protein
LTSRVRIPSPAPADVPIPPIEQAFQAVLLEV